MYLTRIILTCIILNAAFAKFLNVREEECLVQGVQCTKNCSAVVYCLTQGGQELLLDDCGSKGENCATIDNQVQCSAVESDCHSIAPEVPFQCVQSGSFPDPLNCSLSFTCQSNNPNPAVKCECERGFFWDTRYGQCSNDPQGLSDCCISLDSKPKCDQQYDGNFGSCHPGYYYVCSQQPDGEFQVVVLRCDPNMIYNPITHSCVPSGNLNDFQEIKQKSNIGPKMDAQCSVITTTSTTEATTTNCIKIKKTTRPTGFKDSDSIRSWDDPPTTDNPPTTIFETTGPWDTDTTGPWDTDTTGPWDTTETTTVCF